MTRIFVLAAAMLFVGGSANVQASSGTAGKSARATLLVADAAATDFSAAKKKRKPVARATSRPASGAGGAGGGSAPTGKPSTDKPLSY